MSVTSFGATRWSMRGGLADEVFDREEAGDRDQREQRGKQREEEVVGLLRGEIEDVVCQRFAERAFQQLGPAERDVESLQHDECEIASAAASPFRAITPRLLPHCSFCLFHGGPMFSLWRSRSLRFAVVCSRRRPGCRRQRPVGAVTSAGLEAEGRRRLHRQDQGVPAGSADHDRARRPPAGVGHRADAAQVLRPHRRHARRADLRERHLPLLRRARQGVRPHLGVAHRQDRGRPRHGASWRSQTRRRSSSSTSTRGCSRR